MTAGRCNLCVDDETAFRVPWGDDIGTALMKAHLELAHRLTEQDLRLAREKKETP